MPRDHQLKLRSLRTIVKKHLASTHAGRSEVVPSLSQAYEGMGWVILFISLCRYHVGNAAIEVEAVQQAMIHLLSSFEGNAVCV